MTLGRQLRCEPSVVGCVGGHHEGIDPGASHAVSIPQPGGGLPCRITVRRRRGCGGRATCKRVQPGEAHDPCGWNGDGGGSRSAPRTTVDGRRWWRIPVRGTPANSGVPKAACRHVRRMHLPVKSSFFRGCKWRSHPLGRALGGCRPHLAAALVLHRPADRAAPPAPAADPRLSPPHLNVRGRAVSVLHPAPRCDPVGGVGGCRCVPCQCRCCCSCACRRDRRCQCPDAVCVSHRAIAHCCCILPARRWGPA